MTIAISTFVDRSPPAFVGPQAPTTTVTAPVEVALAEEEAALLAKAAAKAHERLLRAHPELRNPEQVPVNTQHMHMQVERFAAGSVDSQKVLDDSFDRHAVQLRGQSKVGQDLVTPSDARFAPIVMMMQLWTMQAKMEREQRSHANAITVQRIESAADSRVTAAEAGLASAITGALVQAGVGAVALTQTVKSAKITANSTDQNVAHANRVDLTTRNNQQAANLGGNKAVARPERMVSTEDGQQVKLPSDADADTPAMRSAAGSQALASEVPIANADHTLASARAQVPHMAGSIISMLAPTINGVVTGAGQVASAEYNRVADLHTAAAELQRQIANERGEQIAHDVRLHESALNLLQTLNSNSAATTNQIIGNM